MTFRDRTIADLRTYGSHEEYQSIISSDVWYALVHFRGSPITAHRDAGNVSPELKFGIYFRSWKFPNQPISEMTLRTMDMD